MGLHFALDGFWLLGAGALVYATGVFTAQFVKDKITGVPSELRAALKATESNALGELAKAKAAVLADIGNIFKRSAAAVAPVAAPVAAPVTPAAPAAPAAPVAPTPAVAPAPAPVASPATPTA